MGRPRLDPAIKAQRGTLRPGRERARSVKARPSKAVPVTSRDFAAMALGYVDDVLAGRIIAGQWTVKACRRFEDMRQRAADPSGPFVWSKANVEDVCGFIERLPHVEGRWTSSTIELQPWQVFVLASCYGFRHRDGRRLTTTVFFEVARKSAKSTLVAAAALYHLAVEQEPGGQVVCAATTGAQARIVFSIMQRMVRRAAWLRDAGMTVFANSIVCEPTGGTAKPINAKSSTQDGLNPSLISLDESHAQDFGLHDVLKSAQGARQDAMLWAPTTAGYSLTSVGFALRSTAMKLLDGVFESDHTFVALYELDPDDDWRDETTWIKSAPMIGVTPTLDYVRRYRDDAVATPGVQGEFEVKVCNRWAHSASTWLSVAAWDRCADPTLSLEAFEREPCWIGVDLAERDDIAAVALVFRRDDLVVPFVVGYLPELVVAERSRRVPEYRTWVQRGELRTTAGNLTDYATIEADLRGWVDRFDVKAITIERFGALNLAANLSNSGLPATIESKNAKVFTAPAKDLEARIRARQLRHAGSSFLKWQISNVCVQRRRDGSLLPTKESAESPNKIDAVDAILLALSAMLQTPSTLPTYEPNIYVLGESRL